ncbi:hypothetical protein GE061_020189 [Apolygus lucorum]|uniref:Uncharacterized protein n=1 Tax=Apolygus lucorum TaxID=248454 RepID=A0A8S9WMA0_APOLU|nr:hypothetical protein GE061_020189 [Apolygus lucorum]
MHHYPLNQERAINLSILPMSWPVSALQPYFPRNPKALVSREEAPRRVIGGTSADRWLASFMVRTRAVSDRLRTSNFRS